MKRRDFVAGLGGAVAWPLAARAQQGERVRRIGVLVSLAEEDLLQRGWVNAFRKGLNELGWFEGRNILVDYRWAAGDLVRMGAFAKELVGLNPEALLGVTTPATAALRRETTTIPIVFTNVSDPIGSAFVATLSHPGGNTTGFINVEGSLGGKWVGFLKEIAPQLSRVAMMFNPKTAPYASYYLRPFQIAATALGLTPIEAKFENDADIEQAVAGLESGGGLIAMPDTSTGVSRKLIIALAARYRVPAVYPFRFFASEGGLIAYGIDIADLHVRAASYVDRILKGTSPSDLPVEVPTKFESAVNLITAKALGIEIPPTLISLVDEVIE